MTMTKLDQPTQDEVYYQTVVFHVGNTLFRVLKSSFNVPGTIFETMFSLPPTAGTVPEGSSDDSPIVLNDDENAFRAFLRVICKTQKVTDEDWLSALDLATKWNFDEVRREAIKALDGWTKSQSLKQVILTARKYNVIIWLKVAYSQLVANPFVDFPLEEMIKPPSMDWETIAKLIHIKHQYTISDSNEDLDGGCKACGFGMVCCGYVDPLVEETFEAEFEPSVEGDLKCVSCSGKIKSSETEVFK